MHCRTCFSGKIYRSVLNRNLLFSYYELQIMEIDKSGPITVLIQVYPYFPFFIHDNIIQKFV